MSGLESRQIATYHLTHNSQNELVDADGKDFDPESYSRMKWGIRPDTVQFANELVDTLVESEPNIIENSMVPGLIVVYDRIPHAATLLVSYALDQINSKREETKMPPGRLIHVYAQDYPDDYAYSTYAERHKIIEQQKQTLELRTGDIKEVRPVLIDDIYVTGETTRSIIDFINHKTDSNVITGYVAVLDEDIAKKFPNLEGDLDSSGIESIEELIPFIESGDVHMTHRLLKTLKEADDDTLKKLLSQIPSSSVTTLLEALTFSGV